MRNNLRVKPHERVVIVSDTHTANSVGALFFQAAKEITPHLIFIELVLSITLVILIIFRLGKLLLLLLKVKLKAL